MSTPVPDLVATVVAGRSIVRTLVPLLLAQLALLAVTVLALMAHAAVEQRRPEIALARLRGRSRDGGGRVVMSERLPHGPARRTARHGPGAGGR